MWKIIILFFLPSVTADLLFQQNDYQVTFERLELVEYNKDFVKDFKIVTFKYNRTTTVINATMTYVQDLDWDLQMIIQAYKFASNEYRLFPMRFQFDFCNSMEKNDFGFADFCNCGNFTKCPTKKGRYLICNWSPDGSRFPPFVPSGRYMINEEVYHANTKIYVKNMYINIYRPITSFEPRKVTINKF